MDQAGRHDGLFLIRKNRDIHGAFVLSLCHDKKVTHHKVHCTNGELGLDAGPQFDDLQSLVEHYTQSKVKPTSSIHHETGKTSLTEMRFSIDWTDWEGQGAVGFF